MGNLNLLIWVFVTNFHLLPTMKNKIKGKEIKSISIGDRGGLCKIQAMDDKEKKLLTVAQTLNQLNLMCNNDKGFNGM